MTPRERALAVYEGRTPDKVPLLLDISHWYKKNYNVPFDLTGLQSVDETLVRLHRELDAVAYVEMGRFYDLYFEDDDVSDNAWTADGVYYHELKTPIGSVVEERVFAQSSYSYNIRKRLLSSVEDFEIVKYAMERYRVKPSWEKYEMWSKAHGDRALIYLQLPYSGLGYLISRNFGVEKTVYAAYDEPEATRSFVDAVNACNLRILDEIIDLPFEVMIQSDNMDGNVQTPDLYDTYSRAYYTEVAARLHAKGKYFAVHVDGEMRGCLRNLRESGIDCIDAATPAPMFSQTPAEAREEAGPDMILSGGIPPTTFSNTATEAVFEKSVRDWLAIKELSPRLFLAAGDQVPPDAPWGRVKRLPALIEEYGRYDS